ncbi:MAG: sugar phosphate nucleotidyltransferase [bacterium]
MADTPQRMALVLAGGIGERFWPLSRPDRPKQLLPLGPGGSSLLEDTIERVEPFIPAERVLVVTGGFLVDPIREADLGIPDGNVIAEPAKRNTAGALVFAAARLLADRGEGARGITLAVLPADHRIQPPDAFRQDLERALVTVEEEGGLAVMGIEPARPETGYGYIEADTGATATSRGALPVEAFKEKPDEETAAGYTESGRHYWNSGMFFWRLGEFLAELEKASPPHHGAVGPLADHLREGREEEARELFERLPDVSIDYALMEKAERVWMIPASFRWDDLGAWDALRRVSDLDGEGNLIQGPAVVLESRESTVVNDAGEEMTVSVVGVEGLTVVVTSDAVLVVPTERAQQVREAVRELKEREESGR